MGGAALLAACSSADPSPALAEPDAAVPQPVAEAGVDAPPASPADPFDVPIATATVEERAVFRDGDRLFGLSLRDADGLGPLYTRASCGGCHTSGTRGPGVVQKMAIVEADGFTPDADQSALPFGNTVRPLITGSAHPLLPPPGTQNLKVTTRVGPSILGRGYMEAVLDSEIERVAAAQATRADGIHGRVNHVVYASEANPDTRFHAHRKGDVVIGRFGLKARIATLDDFTADALQSDMGITSPLRIVEPVNPDGLADDAKAGIDVAIDSVNTRAMYVRLTAIPLRKIATAPAETAAGEQLFAQTKCSVCHAPSLRTRPDYPIAGLADIEAPVFSDLLLHDMGSVLADGIRDGEARSQDWRTAPLVGLRFVRTFLHDARATSIEEAILMHEGPGSEANGSVTSFRALSPADRATLLAYVGAL
ncbi:MAG: putative thiol oxidoreductase with 2 cytochrome c heme-binding site [Labilithrix sp.]|nr:putative thiol oxidoreductase with 2 cytochrome c heme-binding site [Labilithrix sp.]